MTLAKTGLAALAALTLFAAPASGQPAKPAQSAPSPPSAAPTLSTQGFGPLQVGMTWTQAHAAMPSLSQGDTATFEGCYEATTPLYPGLYVMFTEGRLARVTAAEASQARTVRGVGVGMTEAEVRRLVPTGLEQQGHEYEAPPAKYLTFWASGRQRGVRFEIGHNGRVSAIHAGGEAITYSEGCA